MPFILNTHLHYKERHFNHCCPWIEIYLHIDVLFTKIFILGVKEFQLWLSELYCAHQSRKYSPWKSSPVLPAPAVGICIKQDGETHRAKDDIEILLLIFLYYPCQKEKKNFEVRFGKIYKRPGTDGTFYRIANAGSMVAIRALCCKTSSFFTVKPTISGVMEQRRWCVHGGTWMKSRSTGVYGVPSMDQNKNVA